LTAFSVAAIATVVAIIAIIPTVRRIAIPIGGRFVIASIVVAWRRRRGRGRRGRGRRHVAVVVSATAGNRRVAAVVRRRRRRVGARGHGKGAGDEERGDGKELHCQKLGKQSFR
jgi:hypothetical protein